MELVLPKTTGFRLREARRKLLINQSLPVPASEHVASDRLKGLGQDF